MIDKIIALDQFIESWLKHRSGASFVIRIVLVIYSIIKEIPRLDFEVYAKSLVYTTLLSLVPLLAVSFSLLKVYGMHNQALPLLLELLAPLGSQGAKIANTIVGFIDNVDVSVLGVIGVLILLFTVVSVISKVENIFNNMWHVKQQRKFWLRAIYYIGTLLFVPVLVMFGVAVTASLMNTKLIQFLVSIEPFGSVYYFIALLLPYVFLTTAFVFLYYLLPNTKVKIVPAFIFGLFAATAWKGLGVLFSQFVVRSSNYDAIYSGFAALILFLIWLYLSWLIVLLGGRMTYLYQHWETIGINDDEGELHDNNARNSIRLFLLLLNNLEKGFIDFSFVKNKMDLSDDAVLIIVQAMEKEGMLEQKNNFQEIRLVNDFKNKFNLSL